MEISLRDKLTGSWKLVSYTSEKPDGGIIYPLGADAQGSILYTADGYVSVHIMPYGRTGEVEGGQYNNGVLFYSNLPYIGYSGRYIIDENRPSVTHLVEICIDPAWVGQRQFRVINWIGDVLQLSADRPTVPGQNYFSLRWRRNSAGSL